MREWQNVLILGWKRWFPQLRARCWKSLKSSACQCENDKTCWSRAENAVLHKLVHIAENDKSTLLKRVKKWCTAECENVKTWEKCADLRLKTLFCTNSCTLLKSAKKWWAQRKNNKSVLILGWKHCFAQTEALCWKSLKSGAPKCWKWNKQCENENVLISGWKISVCWQTKTCPLSAKMTKRCWSRAENAPLYRLVSLCWKELKSGAPSAEMTVRADLGLITLFWTNWVTLLKITKKWCA